MPIPATNIKTISKIASFRFIKFSFSACFCSVIIILYFTIYRNCVPPFPVREDSLCNAKAYYTRVLHCGGLHEPVGAFIGRPP